MDIPLPSPGTNGFVVNAMTGGANAFNQVQQGNLQNQLLGQQNQYYAPQMQAQIGLAQTQARYMPAMLSAQLLSNPMYVAILSSTPQGRMQLQSLSQQAVNGVSNPQMGGYGQGMPQQNQNGLMGSIANSPMGSLYRYATGGNNGQQQPQAQQNALNQPTYGTGATANYGRPSSDVTTYLQQGQNTQAQPANQSQGNSQNAIPGIGQAATGLVQRMFAPGESMPFTGRGTGLGAGTTYTDPNTGQQFSSDTVRQAATDQAMGAGVDRVAPLIQQLVNNYPQFQGVLAKAKLYGEQGINALTQNTPFDTSNTFKEPSQLGLSETALNLMPEGLAKAYGINATDQARAELRKAMEPVTGENPQQYSSRLIGTLELLRQNQQEGNQRLAVGTNVTQGEQAPRTNGSYVPSPSQIPSTNAIANNPSTVSNGIAQVNLSGASKNLARTAQFPDFSTQGKAAARAWYAKQPATVQRAYLASLGSQ